MAGRGGGWPNLRRVPHWSASAAPREQEVSSRQRVGENVIKKITAALRPKARFQCTPVASFSTATAGDVPQPCRGNDGGQSAWAQERKRGQAEQVGTRAPCIPYPGCCTTSCTTCGVVNMRSCEDSYHEERGRTCVRSMSWSSTNAGSPTDCSSSCSSCMVMMERTPSCCSDRRAPYSCSTCSTPRALPESISRSPSTRHDCSAPGEANGSKLEVFALYASPLNHPPINVRSEVEALHEALLDSRATVQLQVGVASANSLTKMLTMARSRRGLVLHLSAHALRSQTGEVGLVLEDAHGAAHILWRQRLEEFLWSKEDGLRSVSLLFLSCCWSEELAQVFVECGCPHVIALRAQVNDSVARRFSQHLYLSLAVGESLLVAWNGARGALRMDSDSSVAEQAEHFVLFGQRGADAATLTALCGREAIADGACESASSFSSSSSSSKGDLEAASTFLNMRVPPRVEHFVGRTRTSFEVLNVFGGNNGRRACVVHGPEGIGKSAFSLEFAHFSSAPGRLFSCAVGFVRIESTDLTGILDSVEDEMRNLAVQFRAPLLPASGDSRRSSVSCLSARSSHSDISITSSVEIAPNVDPMTLLLPVRQRIRRGFQQIERQRRKSRILLVIDDQAGAVAGSHDVRRLLGELLEHTYQLRVLICSRDPVYESLGAAKVVNLPLDGLDDLDASRLFLQRIHRRLEPRDFEKIERHSTASFADMGASRNQRPAMADVQQQLCGHPLLRRLEGNPGRIRMVSSRVTPKPDGPSLMDLAKEASLFDPGPNMLKKVASTAVSGTECTPQTFALTGTLPGQA